MEVVAPIKHVEIVDGKPMIRQVKVRMIASMYVRAKASVEDIMEQYNLSAAEVHAALAYYYDNQAAFDESFREDEALAQKIGTPLQDVIARMQARSENKAQE